MKSIFTDDSLKRTYVEGVTRKKNMDERRRRGVKNWKFRANELFEWSQDKERNKNRDKGDMEFL